MFSRRLRRWIVFEKTEYVEISWDACDEAVLPFFSTVFCRCVFWFFSLRMPRPPKCCGVVHMEDSEEGSGEEFSCTRRCLAHFLVPLSPVSCLFTLPVRGLLPDRVSWSSSFVRTDCRSFFSCSLWSW